MTSYILGTAVLFTIGFITYEVYESVKKVKQAVEQTPTPFQTANDFSQSLTPTERIGLYAVQPLGLTLAELAYNEF